MSSIISSTNDDVAANDIDASAAAAAESSGLYEFKEQLLLLATLVASVTYVAGLNLPGGSWQQDDPEGHLAGDPILRDTDYRRYLAFYYCNGAALAASLVVSLILVVLPRKSTVWTVVLRVVMVLDLLALVGAYGAGSCRDTFTTIYSALAFSLLVLVIVYVFLSSLWRRTRPSESESHDNDIPTDGDERRRHKEQIDVLMVLATFAVTITYDAGLSSPPGGFWSSSSQDGHHHHHRASEPVLQASSRYRMFFLGNTTAFVASLLIVVLLLEKRLLRDKRLRGHIRVRFVALYGVIAVALLGLIGAYAAGSCREADHTIFVLTLTVAAPVCVLLQVMLVTCTIGWKQLEKICDCVLQPLKKLVDIPQGTCGAAHVLHLQNTRSLVLLLATLVVTVTYQAGLDPPGGLWQDDLDGHKIGHPVLETTHPARYRVFFYSNSAAFVTSLVAIMMLQSRFLLQRHTLEATLVLDLFGLITAYAAGSTRDVYASFCIVALAGLVLFYVITHITISDHHPEPVGDAAVKDLDDKRKVLLLSAILAATLTYQAGLTPPGGFWSADEHGLSRRAGFPVLLDNYPRRYQAFFYCNAASFMASVILILLLVNPKLYRPGIRCYALYVCMVVGMFGLMGAYAAGSSRHLKTSIYVLTLVAAVLAFIASQVAIFWIFRRHQSNSMQAAYDGSSSSSHSQEKDMAEYLMLLGILGASMTYQTGLKPPGGLWQDNNNGHEAGNPILHDTNTHRYTTFFYSNSTSFMASIMVIAMVLPLTRVHNHKLPLWPMHTAILLDMLGLLVAYAAGSTREWETSRNVIFLIIPLFVYIALYAAASIFFRKKHDQGGSGTTTTQNANHSVTTIPRPQPVEVM